ncbi:MAG: RNB domain-containing ribonuclease [Bacteroidales bacterium]|nr:RNB domain-containing ribonuclease [Bacteroidales bacterium]
MHAILTEYELPLLSTRKLKDASINGMITEKDIRERKTSGMFPLLQSTLRGMRGLRPLALFARGERWATGAKSHVADVTYYVKPGSLTEEEARQRATSVYLVDKWSPCFPN